MHRRIAALIVSTAVAVGATAHAAPAAGPAAAPAPAPVAAPAAGWLIAGVSLHDEIVVGRLAADGTFKELIHVAIGDSPSLRWLDAHSLVALGHAANGDDVLLWVTDGAKDAKRSQTFAQASWPADVKDSYARLEVVGGQVWIVRDGQDSHPSAYRRVDVAPATTTRAAPAGLVNPHDAPAAAVAEARAQFAAYPSVATAPGVTVTRGTAKLGNTTYRTVRCAPAKGKPTTWPTAATHPFLRLDVDQIRNVSPTLPLMVVAGKPLELPEDRAFESVAMLGCARAPLHTLAWLGGDAWLMIEGAPDGAGFSDGDPRKLELWVNGKRLARLPLLMNPKPAP